MEIENQEKKIQIIKNIIKRGILQHQEILSQLYQADLAQIDSDEVIRLVLLYKYNIAIGIGNKILKAIWSFLNKIGAYISAILGAVVVAEIIAAKAFSGSLLEEKLQGIGAHFLYWLGIKKIQISGPEMITAMTKVITATPDILKGMALGLIAGFILWKIIMCIISLIYKKRKIQRDIYKLLSRYTKRME